MRRRNKQNFFRRLTGIVTTAQPTEDADEPEEAVDEYSEEDPDVFTQESADPAPQYGGDDAYWTSAEEPQDDQYEEGHLPIDMYETSAEIVIKTFAAGVAPQDLDITITREMVTVRGNRTSDDNVNPDNHYYQELYWGPFSRTVVLPEEIEVEEADATERYGLLILTLPKVKKDRETKVRVRSG